MKNKNLPKIDSVGARLPILSYAFILVTVIAAIVVGSVYDYELAELSYVGQLPEENIFGIIFAFIGIVPTFVGWSFFSGAIFYLSDKGGYSKRAVTWLRAVSVGLAVLSVFYFPSTLLMVNEPAFSVKWYIVFPIGLLVLALAWLLGFKFASATKREGLLMSFLHLAAVTVTCLIIIAVVKRLSDRPRYRLCAFYGNGDEYFRAWWQGGADVSAVVPDTTGDEFMSFPSGHSAYSLFAAFLLPTLARFSARLERYAIPLTIFGIAWWGATAFSRMTVGAHYLTDIAFGALVMTLSYAIVTVVFFFVQRKMIKK